MVKAHERGGFGAWARSPVRRVARSHISLHRVVSSARTSRSEKPVLLARQSHDYSTAFARPSAPATTVAAQNQALSALLFLYREVLDVELPWLDGLVRAKPPHRLPVVLTREEVRAILGRLDGVSHVMAVLLYGAGLRLLECCRSRVQDVDF